MVVFRRWRDVVVWWLVLAGLVGGLVRLFIQDRFMVLAWIYYGAPWVVIGLPFLFASLLLWRRRVLSCGLLLIGMICVVGWWQGSCYEGKQGGVEEEGLRLALWNVGRVDEDEVDRVLARLFEMKPDIVALIESGDISRLKPTLPSGYSLGDLGGGLTLLVKGTIENPKIETFGYRNRIGSCKVVVENRTWPILLVDLDSNPLASRHGAMERVAAAAQQHGAAFILGDFNTPSDATAFNLIRPNYAHAFEQGGSGLRATWPSICPIWDVDHIWIDGASVGSAKIIRTTLSDHCIVVTDLRFPQAEDD